MWRLQFLCDFPSPKMAAASASSSKNNLADDPSAWDCFNMWTFLFEEEYDAKLKLEQSMASLPTAGFHVGDITEFEFSPYGRDCEFSNELQIEESDYIKARDTLIAVLLAAAESLWTEEGSQVAEICLQTSEKFAPVTDLSCFRKNKGRGFMERNMQKQNGYTRAHYIA